MRALAVALGRQADIFYLDIVRMLLLAETHRMHRQPAIAQRLQCIERQSPNCPVLAVFSLPSLNSTIAPTGRSAVSVASCFKPSLNMRGSFLRRNALWSIDRREFTYQAGRRASGNASAARREPSLECGNGRSLSRLAVTVRNAHAARVVHDHGNDVLLRAQLPATIIAGCQSRNSTKREQAPIAAPKSPKRASPAARGTALRILQRISSASPPAAARINTGSSQTATALSSAKLPFREYRYSGT